MLCRCTQDRLPTIEILKFAGVSGFATKQVDNFANPLHQFINNESRYR